MKIKALAKLLYGFFGALFLLAGITVMLLGTGLLPDAIKTPIINIAHDDLNTLHITQEFASLMVFAGLITFWFIRHYEQSKLFHWAMTIFWALFALAHWFDAKGGFHSSVGHIFNTAPFVLFVLVGLIRSNARSER